MIGCGQYDCSIDVVAETMVSEAKHRLQVLNYPMEVVFVLQADRQDLYDTFIKQKNRFDGSIHEGKMSKSQEISFFLFKRINFVNSSWITFELATIE